MCAKKPQLFVQTDQNHNAFIFIVRSAYNKMKNTGEKLRKQSQRFIY